MRPRPLLRKPTTTRVPPHLLAAIDLRPQGLRLLVLAAQQGLALLDRVVRGAAGAEVVKLRRRAQREQQ